MSEYLPSQATRTVPVQWTQLVSAALAVVPKHPSEEVRNALEMLDGYAAASPDLTGELSPKAVESVKEYASLLVALDDAVQPWPLVLRQRIALPAVTVSATCGTGTAAAATRTAEVRTPRAEALVLCWNAAVHHLESGLAHLTRVNANVADAVALVTPAGGSVAAPNQHAKLAARHFRQALSAVQWAETLEAPLSTPSAVALQQLRGQLPLRPAREWAVLCATVATYVYALSSASTKDKPDTLAKLAFDAAQLPLPSTVPSTSSLHLLPTFLLVAYHYHKATWYYAGEKELGPALGHLRHADALLRQCEARWAATSSQPAPQGLVSKFTSLWSRRKNRGTAEGMNEDDETASATAFQPNTRYPQLYRLLKCESSNSQSVRDATASTPEATPDVAQVHPYSRLLLHDVCAALRQYEKENNVVYFARVTTAADVRRDVPDVHTPGETQVAAGDTAAHSLLTTRTAAFASLPSAEVLKPALEKQHDLVQAQQSLLALEKKAERDRRQLHEYVTAPAGLEQALNLLENFVEQPSQWASVDALIAAAGASIEKATTLCEQAAAAWQEDRDQYVGTRCPPHPLFQETQTEAQVWHDRAKTALAQWKALRLFSDVHSRDGFVDALVPHSAEIYAYLDDAEVGLRDAVDISQAAPDATTVAQVRKAVAALEPLQQRGQELLRVARADTRDRSSGRHRRRHSTSQLAIMPSLLGEEIHEETENNAVEMAAAQGYATAAEAARAVAEVLQEAPMVVQHVEHTTAQLQDMQKKARLVPLGQVKDVRFLAEPQKGHDGLTSTAGIPRQHHICSGTRAMKNEAMSTLKREAEAEENSTATSVQTASSRKRLRSPSATDDSETTCDGDAPDGRMSPLSQQSDDFHSVDSSQLAEAEEAAPTPAEGTTRATVSSGLLRRMQQNKAKRLAVASAVGVAAKEISHAPTVAAQSNASAPASSAKKASTASLKRTRKR